MNNKDFKVKVSWSHFIVVFLLVVSAHISGCDECKTSADCSAGMICSNGSCTQMDVDTDTTTTWIPGGGGGDGDSDGDADSDSDADADGGNDGGEDAG